MARIYSTTNNADLIALESASGAVDLEGVPTSAADTAAARVPIFDALLASGLTTAQAAAHANPNTTRKLITFAVTITGTAVEADVEAILIAYVNTLGTGADVVAATASGLVLAHADVASVTVFELSLDADPTGETTDLTIGAAEIAYTDADAITFTDAG